MKSYVGKESFHRMNYLYQASRLMVSTKATSPKERAYLDFLSTYYSNLMINIAKKSVLRIEPDIKRTVCKGCHGLLIPFQTATISKRTKPSNVVLKCKKCQTDRIFGTNKNYEVWSEKQEAILDILD